MAQHTVFGSSAPPYSLTVFSDGSPSITLGNYLYPYGSMATGWYCGGGRVYIPNDATLFGQQITIKMWKTPNGGSPVDLAEAPLQEVTVATPSSAAGWIEGTWEPVQIDSGDMVFIGYSFVSPREAYYMHTNSAGAGITRSVDDVDLVLAEATITTLATGTSRGRFRQGSTQGTSTAWYGVDIIVTDSVLPDPIAAYGFNETSGTTAYDETGNGHDLTVNSPTNFAMSREGNGLHQLTDPNNKITNAAPWLETAQRTMMFWGRRGSEGTGSWSKTVYQDDSGGNGVFGIFLNDNADNTYFRVRINGSDVNHSAPETSIGTWAHYALTYDGSYVRSYIDGTMIEETAVSGSIDPSDGNLSFFGDDYQQHVIDDLRLFDTALTEAQVQYYMNDTIVAPDTEPPTVPANVQISNTYQVVSLDWDESTDNVELQNYIVYRSATSGFTPGVGNQVGGPNTNAYSETAPVGTWYYRVAARDEAGNISAASSEVSVTTTANPVTDYYFPSGALSLTPGTPTNENQPTGLMLGVVAALSAPAQISGVRFYSPSNVASGVRISLFENGSEVVIKTGLSLTTGWNELTFDTPYTATTGLDYMAFIYLPGPSVDYTAVANAYPTSTTYASGPLYSTLTANSRMRAGLGTTFSASSSWYGIDFISPNNSGGGILPFGADIVEENALPGAAGPEYTISGAGDTSNLGFAREFSVNVGETVDFSCHGDGTVIDIYRIGYYGGLGWRKVASISNSATQQPDPNVIPNSNGGVECSNWSTTASWTVPNEAISGLFIGVYRNAALDNASYIPFVVRNDAQTADMIYKTSDTTWGLAYNYYGTPSAPLTGKSVYGSGGPLGSIGQRTHAVSYHRPIVTREGVSQTYWMACEAPMIRFIERNGINVKYVASRDIDVDASVLDNANVILSSGHDEYWSDGMRDGVEAARDDGSNLIFFSGNEVFWRTRFDSERNTMWCYKDTMDGPGAHVGGTPLDPVSWTGTWKDTRFPGRKPEHTITGTDFRMNGVNDYAATFYQNGSYATHPFWRDTTITSGNFTVQGVIGFEADEILPTQPSGSYVTLANHNFNIDGKRADDNGQEYAGSGDLNWGVISQRYASGAVVVGFGTCQWSWGLDGVHDRGGNYVNANMQQATLNLFADLGAVPATTISGLMAPTPVGSLNAYGLVPDSGRSGKVKIWSGSTWDAHPLKVWDGAQWVARKAKGYDGSSFVDGKG